MASPLGVISLYSAAIASLVGAVHLRQEPPKIEHNPLVRGLARGEVRPGIPRLDPDDAMANAAILRLALNEVGTPGFDERDCDARPRTVSVLLDGRLSRVRFGARVVCQLRKLKQISAAQPGFGKHGLGEVAAFLLGRRMPAGDAGDGPDVGDGAGDDEAGDAVDVTRVVVPPFRFSRDTVRFVDADLGALLPHEKLIGTYHTHPDDDLTQGLLSTTDLAFMHRGRADFHGEVGWLGQKSPRVDWLLDIVEPRDGHWNVFAHDGARLAELYRRCQVGPTCPLDQLRIVGSPFYVLTRFYELRSPWHN
jgi:hypothetical protein